MLAGLNRDERARLNLEGYSPANLRYLQNGDIRQDEQEDAARFQAWKACLGILGIPFLDVVRVLAAVLLLGNVQFIDGQVSWYFTEHILFFAHYKHFSPFNSALCYRLYHGLKPYGEYAAV